MRRCWFHELPEAGRLRQAQEWDLAEAAAREAANRLAESRDAQNILDLEMVDRCLGRGRDGWTFLEVQRALAGQGRQLAVTSKYGRSAVMIDAQLLGSAYKRGAVWRLLNSLGEPLDGEAPTLARAIGMLARWEVFKRLRIRPTQEQMKPEWTF